MKTFTFFTLAFFLGIAVLSAQTPQSFRYQAVARDNSGNVLANQSVSFRISILSGSVSGTMIYRETHTGLSTNAFGLVELEIGKGKPVNGTFSAIDWGINSYFVQVEMDPAGGKSYQELSTSQLLSVPYALHANTAESISGGITETDPVYKGSQAANITAAEIAKLSNLSGSNTGDQDLSGLATITALTAGLNTKVVKVTGKDLSTEDYTTAEKTKLSGIATGAEVNVQADWNQATTTADDYIKNKPAIPSQYTDAMADARVTAGITNKVDKEAGKGLSPNGTAAGQMQYWNGTAWVTVGRGSAGQVLIVVNGVPTWGAIQTAGTGDVQNPKTGVIWKDRNLGATQVAISSTDANAYGDLYQWGRAADGHQIRTSGTTTTLSSSDTPAHGNFILTSANPNDWRSPQNDNLWQGVSGANNPCPAGYRLPTEAEWNAERLSWGSNNAAGAFASPLKLPVAGFRSYINNGSIYGVGSFSHYWSSTVVDGVYSRYLYFSSSNANMYSNGRVLGYSVRCLKD